MTGMMDGRTNTQFASIDVESSYLHVARISISSRQTNGQRHPISLKLHKPNGIAHIGVDRNLSTTYIPTHNIGDTNMAYSKALTQATAAVKAKLLQSRRADANAVVRAVNLGKALLHLRHLVDHEIGPGHWTEYLNTELKMTPATYQRYVRIARSDNPKETYEAHYYRKVNYAKRRQKALKVMLGASVSKVDASGVLTVNEAVERIHAILQAFVPKTRKRILADVRLAEEGMTTKKALAILKKR